MDPWDQYYRVLKHQGLDGMVALEVLDLSKAGKLNIGELNGEAINDLKGLPTRNAIEVLQYFSNIQCSYSDNRNGIICNIARQAKDHIMKQGRIGMTSDQGVRMQDLPATRVDPSELYHRGRTPDRRGVGFSEDVSRYQRGARQSRETSRSEDRCNRRNGSAIHDRTRTFDIDGDRSDQRYFHHANSDMQSNPSANHFHVMSSAGKRTRDASVQRSKKFSSANMKDDFDENEVFMLLVKRCGGLTTFDDFVEKCNIFPKEVDVAEWLQRHSRKFHLIKENSAIKYVIPFYADAKLCLDYNQSKGSGCEKKDCECFHICRAYVAGYCKDGKKCGYSHHFGGKINRDNKRRLGLTNLFTDEDLCIIMRNRYPMVCPTTCEDENVCPFLHLCKKFLVGNCFHGSSCKYGHNMRSGHNFSILEAHGWANYVLRGQENFVKKLILFQNSKTSKHDAIENDTEPELVPEVDDLQKNEGHSDTLTAKSNNELLSNKQIPPMPTSKNEMSDTNTKGNETGVSLPPEPVKTERVADLKRHFENISFQKDTQRMYISKQNAQTAAKPDVGEQKGTSLTHKMQLQTTKPKFEYSWLQEDAENKHICRGYLDGRICKGCDKLHHPVDLLPYQWQIKIDNKWICVDQQSNQTVEQGFCSIDDYINTYFMFGGSRYQLRIMIKHAEAPAAYMHLYADSKTEATSHQVPVRRISTESYIQNEDSAGFSTQWRWFWKDDNGIWLLYDQDFLQRTLESKYIFGQPKFHFKRPDERYSYRIDFKKFKQWNLSTGKERDITRRPIYVSSSDITHKNYPEVLRRPTFLVPRPSNFSPWDLTCEFERIPLDHREKEFLMLKVQFEITMPCRNFSISSISRIQNLKLFSEYNSKKKSMVMDSNSKVMEIEKNLFYGVENKDNLTAVCTNNFGSTSNRKKVTKYGEGLYFAVNANYAHLFTSPGVNDHRYIIRAKVLTGVSTVGHNSYKRPPLRPGCTSASFDSCVDNTYAPNVHVIFDTNQCYPEYVISYTEGHTAVYQAQVAKSVTSQ